MVIILATTGLEYKTTKGAKLLDLKLLSLSHLLDGL